MAEGVHNGEYVELLTKMSILVPKRLLLCGWRRACSFGVATESEVSRYTVHSVILRLAYVRLPRSTIPFVTSLIQTYSSDALMEECVRMMQQTLRASPSVKKRAKSVYSQRNLGTIKDRKREKQQEKEVSNGETILRILRMR